MSFDSGTKIGRYEIRSLLGAGGMGEVYRAFDARLERAVAVKILKHADDDEKLRRFRQEAKAVSALNHPNILTIYEVGEYKKSHYIVSELVAGENLREVVNCRKLSPGEILDIGIQIGNALAAAHALGIIHRDIKPENIMILPDDYVKVLDFGLAKIVSADKAAAHDSEAETASLIQTKAGMLLGTINYMSPEQLRGKTVDERTDVWSLGVCLFEMFTRRRPFTGESSSDVIAAVLEHALPPASELDSIIPHEIELVIAKALEKKADDRFQTAKEFVAALKDAKATWISGSFVAFNKKAAAADSFQSQKTRFTERITTADGENLSGLFIAGAKIRGRVVALLGLVLTATLALVGWYYVNRQAGKQTLVKQKKIERLTTTGNIMNGAISPDGRFVVYARNDNGQQSLWLRPTDEATAKELIPASAETYTQLTFAPDGDWIYYTVFSSNGIGRLNRIKKFGSSQQEISRDVDSTISFAPDGKSFAFIRGNPIAGVDQIVVSNADGSGERVLSERRQPEFFSISTRESVAWSPDGKTIASPAGRTGADGEFMSVVEISVETGAQKPATDAKWFRVGRVLWTKNTDELLITAADIGADSFQIRKISRADGQAVNITSELSDFYNFTLNADSTQLLGVAYDRNSSIYTASRDEPSKIQQIAGGSYDGIGGACWTADGRIVYTSAESGNRDIWTMDAGGASRRQLTFDKAADDSPAASNDGKYIVFVSARSGVPHIWRMNPNGGEAKQLTDKGGESSPIITPDGSFVVYSSRTEGRPRLWKVSVEGGESTPFTEEISNGAAISPDNRMLAYLARGTTFDAPTRIAAASFETGAVLNFFKPAGVVNTPNLPTIIRWMNDSRTIAYAAGINGVSNIWTQTIDGGEPKRLTDFTTDKIFSFDCSKDGKKMLYARGGIRNDLVLIENF